MRVASSQSVTSLSTPVTYRANTPQTVSTMARSKAPIRATLVSARRIAYTSSRTTPRALTSAMARRSNLASAALVINPLARIASSPLHNSSKAVAGKARRRTPSIEN